MSGAPDRINRPAPTLGQDNDEVYRELGGLTNADIDALRTRGVI
jgi:crotonobetainyl-CoA:carnitine CoA-transferase CaiB-like acyl-CoA transferase